MNILMLGLGRIGKQVAHAIIDSYPHNACTITAVSRHFKDDLPDSISQRIGDLTDAEFVASLPFTAADRVIITLSPSTRSEAAYKSAFLDTARTICAELARLPTKPRTLFVSSTAVYGEDAGGQCDEFTEENPSVFNGRILLDAERLYRACLADKLTVVRPSGIYGLGRTYMVKKVLRAQAADAEPINANHYTNRIFDTDLVRILTNIITHDASSDAPNDAPSDTLKPLYLATDGAPASQGEVLTFIANELGVPVPRFIDAAATGKQLKSRHLPKHWLAVPSYREGYKRMIAAL